MKEGYGQSSTGPKRQGLCLSSKPLKTVSVRKGAELASVCSPCQPQAAVPLRPWHPPPHCQHVGLPLYGSPPSSQPLVPVEWPQVQGHPGQKPWASTNVSDRRATGHCCFTASSEPGWKPHPHPGAGPTGWRGGGQGLLEAVLEAAHPILLCPSPVSSLEPGDCPNVG